MKWRIRTLSLAIIWAYFFVYKAIFCYLYTKNGEKPNVDCYSHCLSCMYFCFSYLIIPVFRSGKLSVKSILKSYGAVMLLYMVSLGVQSPLYMIGPFFQPFYRNVAAHFTIFFFLFEWISLWFENRYTTKDSLANLQSIIVRGLSVVILWLSLILYQQSMCKLAQQDATYKVIYEMTSEDLYVYLLYIMALSFRWQIIGYAPVIERLILIILFHLLYKLPFDISSVTVSLIQEPTKNKVLHYVIIYLIIENTSVWFEKKYAPKNTNQQL